MRQRDAMKTAEDKNIELKIFEKPNDRYGESYIFLKSLISLSITVFFSNDR